jgi:hypothetical protein
MAKAKKVALDCTGSLVDRKCKKSTIKLSIDPTPEGWLAKSHARETPVGIVVTPTESPEIKPISMFGIIKGLNIEFESVQVPPERLADLEFLIRAEEGGGCTIRFEGEWAELFG